MAPYMVMPLVGGASCGVSDWMKPRLSMRLVRERQREERSAVHDLSFTNIRQRDTNEAVAAAPLAAGNRISVRNLRQQIVLLVMQAGVEANAVERKH